MLRIRTATDNDMMDVFEIRNIPEVYEGFYTQKEPLTKQEHMTWWYSRNADWLKIIIEIDGKTAGIMHIGQMDHWSPEIGIALKPEYWGKGYGKEAIKEALSILKVRSYKYCHTTILKSNNQSLKAFKGCGFEALGDAREGELWLTKRL